MNALDATCCVRVGPARDGGWALTTKGPEGVDAGHHALISNGGSLYLYPGLGHGMLARCGLSPSHDVRVGGGVKEPWHLLITSTPNMSAYLCEYPDGTAAACHLRDDGTPAQSFCPGGWSEDTLIVLDSKTFEGVVEIRAAGESLAGTEEPKPSRGCSSPCSRRSKSWSDLAANVWRFRTLTGLERRRLPFFSRQLLRALVMLTKTHPSPRRVRETRRREDRPVDEDSVAAVARS